MPTDTYINGTRYFVIITKTEVNDDLPVPVKLKMGYNPQDKAKLKDHVNVNDVTLAYDLIWNIKTYGNVEIESNLLQNDVLIYQYYKMPQAELDQLKADKLSWKDRETNNTIGNAGDYAVSIQLSPKELLHAKCVWNNIIEDDFVLAKQLHQKTTYLIENEFKSLIFV